MSNDCAVSRSALLVLFGIVSGGFARADALPRERVTIRGTGSGVAIERTTTSAPRKRAFFATATALDEAIRAKARGASDGVVIAYLRAHQSDLPPVIEAQDVQQLRKAGAGKSVIAYLATVSALDVGPTGEGREPSAGPAPGFGSEAESAADSGAYAEPYPYAYGMVGGYAAPYPVVGRPSRGRFGFHGDFASRRPVVHREPPLLRPAPVFRVGPVVSPRRRLGE
jgi:hypothetical protein